MFASDFVLSKSRFSSLSLFTWITRLSHNICNEGVKLSENCENEWIRVKIFHLISSYLFSSIWILLRFYRLPINRIIIILFLKHYHILILIWFIYLKYFIHMLTLSNERFSLGHVAASHVTLIICCCHMLLLPGSKVLIANTLQVLLCCMFTVCR